MLSSSFSLKEFPKAKVKPISVIWMYIIVLKKPPSVKNIFDSALDSLVYYNLINLIYYTVLYVYIVY